MFGRITAASRPLAPLLRQQQRLCAAFQAQLLQPVFQQHQQQPQRWFAKAASGAKVSKKAAAASASSSAAAANPDVEALLDGNFVGAKCKFTQTMDFKAILPEDTVDCFRRMNPKGELLDPAYELPFGTDQLRQMYVWMSTLNEMDQVFYDAQRQGRISFYMTSFCEEATQIGSASALKPTDTIWAQYREPGTLMVRGWPLTQFAHQLFSNQFDLGKGRQMPVHYGSRAHHYQTVSSPLATQIPQAAGSAYAMKLAQAHLPLEERNVAICYFGEGAASEGDFHAALNIAATRECPVIFFCRNNGYAISTPVQDQYRGDGIISRAPGYGMAALRVDGNDLFAVYEAVQAARRLALEENRPVLIEAMTYRGGHHSTSDDSTRYRSTEEIQLWNDNFSPITRVRRFMEQRNLWDSAQELELRRQARKDVLAALSEGEKAQQPPASELFTDVLKELPDHLRAQQQELLSHLEVYGKHYGLHTFAPERQ